MTAYKMVKRVKRTFKIEDFDCVKVQSEEGPASQYQMYNLYLRDGYVDREAPPAKLRIKGKKKTLLFKFNHEQIDLNRIIYVSYNNDGVYVAYMPC